MEKNTVAVGSQTESEHSCNRWCRGLVLYSFSSMEDTRETLI